MFRAFLKRPAYMITFVVPIPCSTEAAVVSTPNNSNENDNILINETLCSNIGDWTPINLKINSGARKKIRKKMTGRIEFPIKEDSAYPLACKRSLAPKL
ncbi:hypothetical protein D3C76_1438710 [compost metagenome]